MNLQRIVILFCFITNNLFAQIVLDPFKVSSEDNIRRLNYLNLLYIQSWIKSDTATYNKVLWADDFIHQNSTDGKLYSKSEISNIFGKDRFNNIDFFYPEDVIIYFITPHVAMVLARTCLRLKNNKEIFLGRYNDIYVNKGNNQWKCVSASTVTIDSTTLPIHKNLFAAENRILTTFKQPLSTDYQKLIELNNLHAQGFFENKPELLENVLSDYFILQSANGKLQTKGELLDQMKSNMNNIQIANYQLENIHLRLIADKVVLIHATAFASLENGNKVAVQFTDVYLEMDNRWLCVSGNNTYLR